MSSDEDDYMSDAFLTGCVKEDIRPGLIHSRSGRRNHEMLKKKKDKDVENKNKNPSARFSECEKRESALNQPITTNNKGFAMLQKLGFKPGSGLGKSNEGRTEPVPITLKIDRQGLGRAKALEESISKRTTARKELHSKLTNVDTYRSHLAEKTAERRAAIDLRKSQRICKDLDTNVGVAVPGELWYWPDDDSKKVKNESNVDKLESDEEDNADYPDASCVNSGDEEENEEKEEIEDESHADAEIDDYTVKEKLEMLTYYLRKTYYYCIWCAVKYEDADDLGKECPGPTYDDH